MTNITRTSRLIDALNAHVSTGLGRDTAKSGMTPASEDVAPGARQTAVAPNALAMIRRLHDAGVSDDKVLVSRLIEGLMLEQFGTDTQGANFQFVLSQVMQALEQDPETWALCRECVAEAIG